MWLFFELLTLGLLAGIFYLLQAIAADFKTIRRSELPLVIGELKTANRIGCEILEVVSRTGTPPTHPPHDPRSLTTRARRGGTHHNRQSDEVFMVWCWRDNAWQPVSVPPGFQPGPPPEFDGDYDGESVSVWLPRPES